MDLQKQFATYLGFGLLAFWAGTQMPSNGEKISRQPASQEMRILGSSEKICLGSANCEWKVWAKVDSGAETSSMHATEIETYIDKTDGRKLVRFKTLDDADRLTSMVKEVSRIDRVRNANGITSRIFFKDTIYLAGQEHIIEINLVDRRHLNRKFLLGRTAVEQMGYVIDVGRNHIAERNLACSADQ